MANLFFIIQARMTSTRLPKKVLMPLCSKTVLEVMLERLKAFKENIIIATTNDGSQAPIVKLCKRNDIPYYEGDTNNVLQRYYETAVKYGAKEGDIIVRCTSDCPLIDATISQKAIDTLIEEKADYAVASSSTGFPRGMDTEVFSFALLKEAYENAKSDHEKEHVTPYMYRTVGVKKAKYMNKTDDSNYRLTLDEKDDYTAIVELYKKLGNQTEFSYDVLISTLKENDYIRELNAHVEQKK